MPDPSCGRYTIPSRAGQLHRQPNCSMAGCAPSPLAHASSASHSRSGGAAGASLDFTSRLDTRGGRRSVMVDSPSGPVERPAPSSGSSHDADSLGCSHRRRWRRLGGSVRWSREEQTWHINALELQAAKLAVQSFAKTGVRGRIALQLDNQVAVSYINRMGGTHSPRLDRIARELWEWCLAREITVEAEYLPGSLNTDADFLSKHHGSAEWRLHPGVSSSCNAAFKPAQSTCLDQNQCPAVSLRVLAARATVRQYRRLHSRLAARKGLRLSPIRSSRQGDLPGATAGGAITGAGDTDVEGSSLVSSSVGSDRGPAVSSSGASGPSPRPSGSSSPAGPSGTAAPLRVAHLRSVHAAAGLPDLALCRSYSWSLGDQARPGATTVFGQGGVAGVVDGRWIQLCPFSETC